MAECSTSALNNDSEGHSQVEVCDFCGDRGFTNALINCSECCKTLVHQYCLGIPPGSIDDSFNWLCEYCCAQMECEPCSSTKSEGASMKEDGKAKKQKRETVPCILQSEVPLTLGSKCEGIREERTEDQSLLSLLSATLVVLCECSSSKDDQNTDSLLDHKMDCGSSCMRYCDDSLDKTPGDDDYVTDSLISVESAIIPVEDQPEPLLTVLPIEFHGSLEHMERMQFGSHLLDYGEEPEGSVSSLMESPEELMRGIVLLVSPSGVIFILEDPGICDEDSADKYSQFTQKFVIGETKVLDMPCLASDRTTDACKSENNVEDSTVKFPVFEKRECWSSARRD